MAQVTVLINGKPVTVEETSPGLFGSLRYTYVLGGTNTSGGTTTTSSSGTSVVNKQVTVNTQGIVNGILSGQIDPNYARNYVTSAVQSSYTNPDAYNEFGPKQIESILNSLKGQTTTYNGATYQFGNGGVPAKTSTTVKSSNTSVGSGTTNTSTSNVNNTNTTTTNNTNTGSSSSPVPNIPDPAYDAKVAAIINNPDLTTDQQNQLRESFRIVAENDDKAYKKMVSAYETGIAFATPVMKAQVAMVTSALTEGLKGITGDLVFREQQLTAQKGKLESDLAGSNEMLDFNSKQQLENYKTSLDTDIQTNADNMAATGRASSSVRLKSDALINQNYNGLVESNTKTLAYNKQKNITDTAYDVNQTNKQLGYYQDKAVADRIAKLRDTEQSLGTAGLSNIPGVDLSGQYAPLGNINSELEAKKYKDAFSFATNFF